MNTTKVTTEIGALPLGEDKVNKLVVRSAVRRDPNDTYLGIVCVSDYDVGIAIANWFMRYVPQAIYHGISDRIKEADMAGRRG